MTDYDSFPVFGIIPYKPSRKQLSALAYYFVRILRFPLSSTSDVILVKDLQGNHVLVNSATAEFFNMPVVDIVGKNDLDLFPPEIAYPIIEADQEIIKGGVPSISEDVVVKDGQLQTYSAAKSLWRDAQGNVIGLICVARDISNHKQTEAALQEQTNLLQLILHSMSDGIVVANEQGQFLVFNPAAEQMFGAATDTQTNEWSQQYGLFLADQVTPFPADELPLVRAIQGEGTKDVELFVRHAQSPDGRWVLVNGKALRDESGQLQGGLVVCRDVTDRKQAEDALKQSEAQLQAILDNAPMVIYLKDLQGQFITVNRQFESLFNLSKAEIVGKRNSDLFDKDLADTFDENDRKVLAAGTAMQWEEVAPHDDGLHTYLSLKFPLLTPEGLPYAICGMSTDISDRKQTEIALAQAKEAAEAANRAKSELSG